MNVTFLSKANLIKICLSVDGAHFCKISVWLCHLLVTLTYYCKTLGQAHHLWKLFINKVSQCNYTGLQENSSSKVKVWATDSKSVFTCSFSPAHMVVEIRQGYGYLHVKTGLKILIYLHNIIMIFYNWLQIGQKVPAHWLESAHWFVRKCS